MNIFEEAIVYATVLHTGAVRKNRKTPYILHPMEVAQIISTMTTDLEVMTAGVLHDIVEETDGTLRGIRERFGDRVADLVAAETENPHPELPHAESWKIRKQESLLELKNATDPGVKILWLGDKLSNIRSFAQMYSEKGEAMWQGLNQKDPSEQLWYYRSIAETLEMELNQTGAYKEFIKHINFIWPGTFETEKTRYKKYREYSVEGCEIVGRGAKSVVYQYDDETIIKVYNENNTYKDIERENAIARKAFVAGVPTAISFGIVQVGKQYGSMFELLRSKTVSELISLDNSRVEYYADLMADLAKDIHTTDGSDLDLPDFTPEVYKWIDGGLGYADKDLAAKLRGMLDKLPKVSTLIHGDFHTGNVMMQNGEPLIIDMDRLSTCHPIAELCGVYMFYIGFGELDRTETEAFMGFPYEVENKFYWEFMRRYLGTDDKAKIQAVSDKAALLCYARLVRRVYKKGVNLSAESKKAADYYIEKIRDLLARVDSFDF